ncbi:MAG: homocysteine S-methyltransferase family protein, partial [Planctomycetota bacterium]
MSRNLTRRILILDGAMGTLLRARGLPPGTPPDMWNLERPDAVVRAHRDYARAGAEVLFTNTFGASRRHLERHGAAGRLERINKAAVAHARRAAVSGLMVAGDIGPCGAGPGPARNDEIRALVREQARLLLDAGVDLLALETLSDLEETAAAVSACNDVRGRAPLLVLMAFGREGRTMCGASPAEAAALLERLGADALGANCSADPASMVPVVERLAAATRLPIAAKPSAGLPAGGGSPPGGPLGPGPM